MKPAFKPIGLHLAQTAKAVSRAFDDALAQAGGSTPTWLVLMTLMRDGPGSQTSLAAAVGIQGPTLTHHLDAMQARGLLARTPAPGDRRARLVALTEAGRALFHRLRQAASEHDARLCAGLTDDDLARLRGLLSRLAANVAPTVKGDA